MLKFFVNSRTAIFLGLFYSLSTYFMVSSHLSFGRRLVSLEDKGRFDYLKECAMSLNVCHKRFMNGGYSSFSFQDGNITENSLNNAINILNNARSAQVNLEFLNLKSLPSFNFFLAKLSADLDLRKIIIHDVDLHEFDLTSLKNGKNLSALEIINTTLSSIDLTDFNDVDSFPKLENISIANNKNLTDINIRYSLSALEYLFLGSNNLSYFNLPKGLTNLIGFDISNNQLRSSHFLREDLQSLKYLNISSNKIGGNIFIPESWASLSVINVEKNKIQKLVLPENLVNLEKINASHNELKSFSLTGNFNQLIDLNLHDNRYLSLFMLKKNLPKLQTIDLRNTALKALVLPELPNLKSINLENSKLKNLSLKQANSHCDVRIITKNNTRYHAIPENVGKDSECLIDIRTTAENVEIQTQRTEQGGYEISFYYAEKELKTSKERLEF